MPKAEKKPKRAEKKGKDPNAPKRPLAAYMFFCKETRDKVKNESPDLTFGEIGRVLGQRWAAADDKTKKKFNDMAEADKVRYEEELRAFSK